MVFIFPMHKKKIIVITRNLPPLVGGMERLNWHILDELSQHLEVYTVCPEESTPFNPVNTHSTGIRLRPLWYFLMAASWKALQLARRVKPNFILAGSGLTAPMALIAARITGARSIAYVHGLDVAVKHPLYKLLWVPAICRLDRVIANSNHTAEQLKKIGVNSSRIGIVNPGVSIPEYSQRESENNFRKKFNLGDGPILLSIGRLTTRKGLLEFVKYSLPIIIKEKPHAMLVVIGDTPSDSLYAKTQTQADIQKEADIQGVGNNIFFLGKITDMNTLSNAYLSATVHIFPVREIPGDPEGFGMVAIEAAAHGIPTVAFATGGIVDAVQDGKSGFLVESNNYQKLADLTLKALATSKDFQNSSITFSKKFTWQDFGKKILEQLNITTSTSIV
jgi:phosphatidylinositol alpha-1,6-mannosyltransferase